MGCPDRGDPRGHQDNPDLPDFPVHAVRSENQDLVVRPDQEASPGPPDKMETMVMRASQVNKVHRDPQANQEMPEVQECRECQE